MARLRQSHRVLACSPSEAAALAYQRRLLEQDGVFSLDPVRLFGRRAPLEVEIGSGRGDFIMERARAMPERNFLAIELAPAVFHWLEVGCLRAGLGNLRALRADARPVVNLFLPSGSVAAFHIYFPDPWPKNRHSKHRLFSASFAGGLARALASGGVVYLATDVERYFARITKLLESQGFVAGGAGFTGELRNSFGRKFDLERRAIVKSSFCVPAPPEAAAEQPAGA
jgi:tRNA (guanine-N7-)-methyltransferase